ncbi:MAG: hypothetical protein AAF564_23575 [Bacteroidota bacterium]
MKRIFLTCFLMLGLTGCDLFNLSDETDLLTGRWTSNVVPQAGNCCHLDLTLDSNKGDVLGSGTISTPGQRVGASDEFAVEVTGSIIEERISLTLNSEYNPGTIEGSVLRNHNGNDIVIQVNFSGFGYSGRDIILFPR